MFEEFKELYEVFSNRTYDCLDPEDRGFLKDNEKFNSKIFNLDRKLGEILTRAFDDCAVTESIFKLLHVFGSLIDRHLIALELSDRMPLLVCKLSAEMDEAREIFKDQEKRIQEQGKSQVDRAMPVVAGQLVFAQQIRKKISNSITNFVSLNHPIRQSVGAELVERKYKELICLVISYEENSFRNWSVSAESKTSDGLNKPLLVRKKDRTLKVNFGKELHSILVEIQYLQKYFEDRPLPEIGKKLFTRFDEFRKYKNSLDQTVEMYNYLKLNTIIEEYDLIKNEVIQIDEDILHTTQSLTWNSHNVWDFIEDIRKNVEHLNTRMKKAQDNATIIKKEIKQWENTPMFTRNNNPREESLFNLKERTAKKEKRFGEIEDVTKNIVKYIEENKKMFNAKDSDPNWNRYLKYMDDIMIDGLLKTVAVSFGYLLDETDVKKSPSPLFCSNLELYSPSIIFKPALDRKICNNFFDLMDDIVEDIFQMAALVPRIAKNLGDNYLETVKSHEELQSLQALLIARIEKAAEKANIQKDTYLEYSYLWTENRPLSLEMFTKWGRDLTQEEREKEVANEGSIVQKHPTLVGYKKQIDKYEAIYEKVKTIDNMKIFQSWFKVDITPFKISLSNCSKMWSYGFKKHLLGHLKDSLSDLHKFIEEADEILISQIREGDYNSLLNVMQYLKLVKEKEGNTDHMFQPMQEVIDLLRNYSVPIPDECIVQLKELPEKWLNTKRLAVTAKQQVVPLMGMESKKLTARIILCEKAQKDFRKKFQQQRFFWFNCKSSYEHLTTANEEMLKIEKEVANLQSESVLFEVTVPNFPLMKQCRKEIKMVKQLWDYTHLVRDSIIQWKTTSWANIDVEIMDMECKKFSKDIRAFDKDMRSWNIFIGLETTVKNMLTSLRAIGELQNSAIRDRHWYQLVQATKVQFIMSDDTTLKDLLQLNLHNFEDEVHNIVDKACKELAMEKMIRDLDVTWKTMEFDHDNHKRTGHTLLRASEELIETLEENQVQLQNMMTSKYIGHFFVEISTWQKKLCIVDQIFTLWFDVQRTWCHLESIFIGSDDIRKQLPVDSDRFDKMDMAFKGHMVDMAKNRHVIQATNVDGLAEKLEYIQAQLSLCEKALAEYLETKRLAFPRFYFASSADLLDILSNGNQPLLVARHLTKLFDSMAKLTMLTEDGAETITATHMTAKDGELVEFSEPCVCDGQVEIWLNRLMDTMRETIRIEFVKSMQTYTQKPREKWLFDYPAQVSLAGTQIAWNTEVSKSFSKLEEGYENALKEYYKRQIAMLNMLITLLLGALTKGERQKVMTICTIDVHSRDVVSKMIQLKIETDASFTWQSQLRHRWDKIVKDCFANICDAEFRYWHEYLGNTPRLVITPLTDRCYITLTQSLHLIMGGAPQGPAGTGKTETTKDLGRAIGMMVYVFNCSEQMDYKSCGNIFNRITVEVLSVIAVQVKSIQDAIKNKQMIFDFMGEFIPMNPTVGYFITMNPGYAGRAELPENLKVLFRPCAMCVPDLRLICEIMLVAEGFLEARDLSRKFITLYKLCKELLSNQDHYDWGLRAIKSVLVVAGTLKRSDRDRPEEQVLMRALRDFNTPKIVGDDIPVFLGLISDLFPNLDVPRKRDLEFEKAVKHAACDLKLQPEENFIMKIVQLDEILNVRHSLFIVGDAGSGKTETWKTLFRTNQNLKKKPVFTDLNPKAVTNDELYGIINPATREWKDGLFSNIMRDQANITAEGPKWIILDGDIDPMWIESLNTVMDDNKILTLASNERIALTPEMKLIFEISNLRTATPATVSRAGILYINPGDLGWNPYVTSWIETRENSNVKANLTMLFDKYVPSMQDVASKKFPKITPIPGISHIEVLCCLLDALVIPGNVPYDSPKELYEVYFVFALIWAYGSALSSDGQIDLRGEFSKWFFIEFKHLLDKWPTGLSVFDVWVDPVSNEFVSWKDKVPKFELDTDIPLQACLVHNPETIRIRYFLDLLIEKRFPVMLIGIAGCGKTLIINEKLFQLDENFAIANVPFNFYYSSEMTQKILEKPLEKKAGKNYGPPGGKKLIYFLDDLNMPEVDEYGTVGPHTIIRQHMDYSHWYCRSKLTLKEIHNTQYVACMNPTGGSFTINPRLQRHFATFSVVFPGQEALFTVYNSILSDHLTNVTNKFNQPIQALCSNIVHGTLQLHARCAHAFVPSSTKFHYIFNLRDLTNVFQGILFATNECLKDVEELGKLWAHETNRVYRDKLSDEKDVET